MFQDGAEKMGQLDLQIEWLSFAQQLSESDNDEEKSMKVEKQLAAAKETHDMFLLSEGMVEDSNDCIQYLLQDWSISLLVKKINSRKLRLHHSMRAFRVLIYTSAIYSNTGNLD